MATRLPFKSLSDLNLFLYGEKIIGAPQQYSDQFDRQSGGGGLDHRRARRGIVDVAGEKRIDRDIRSHRDRQNIEALIAEKTLSRGDFERQSADAGTRRGDFDFIERRCRRA